MTDLIAVIPPEGHESCGFCAGTGMVEDKGWSHPGRGFRADYRKSIGDGLMWCGACGGEGYLPDDPADEYRQHMEAADAEVARLRALLAEIAGCASDHMVDKAVLYLPFDLWDRIREAVEL